MIVGLGIDLVDNDRVARELGGERWKPESGVFTAAEIKYCSAGIRPEERYAACFAAKEATLKALSAEITDLGMFRESEVRLDREGECTNGVVVLSQRLRTMAKKLGVQHIHLSLAARRQSVAAMVILES